MRPVQAHPGHFFATHLLLVVLIKALAARKVISRDTLKDIVDDAQIFLEIEQITAGPESKEMFAIARQVLDEVGWSVFSVGDKAKAKRGKQKSRH